MMTLDLVAKKGGHTMTFNLAVKINKGNRLYDPQKIKFLF